MHFALVYLSFPLLQPFRQQRRQIHILLDATPKMNQTNLLHSYTAGKEMAEG